MTGPRIIEGYFYGHITMMNTSYPSYKLILKKTPQGLVAIKTLDIEESVKVQKQRRENELSRMLQNHVRSEKGKVYHLDSLCIILSCKLLVATTHNYGHHIFGYIDPEDYRELVESINKLYPETEQVEYSFLL